MTMTHIRAHALQGRKLRAPPHLEQVVQEGATLLIGAARSAPYGVPCAGVRGQPGPLLQRPRACRELAQSTELLPAASRSHVQGSGSGERALSALPSRGLLSCQTVMEDRAVSCSRSAKDKHETTQRSVQVRAQAWVSAVIPDLVSAGDQAPKYDGGRANQSSAARMTRSHRSSRAVRGWSAPAVGLLLEHAGA